MTSTPPRIVIVNADPPGPVAPDGSCPVLLVGGPADRAVIDIPTARNHASSTVQLVVDGKPATYINASPPRYFQPGDTRLYSWDDPSSERITTEQRTRIAWGLHHLWPHRYPAPETSPGTP